MCPDEEWVGSPIGSRKGHDDEGQSKFLGASSFYPLLLELGSHSVGTFECCLLVRILKTGS